MKLSINAPIMRDYKEFVQILQILKDYKEFVHTRSYAALRAADLDWIVGPGYSFGAFSKFCFAAPVLSSIDNPD